MHDVKIVKTVGVCACSDTESDSDGVDERIHGHVEAEVRMEVVGSAVDFPPLKKTLERAQSEMRGGPRRQHHAMHRGNRESPVASLVAYSYHEGD